MVPCYVLGLFVPEEEGDGGQDEEGEELEDLEDHVVSKLARGK